MSREVRRVPLGYEHPHEYNYLWDQHEGSRGFVDQGIPRDHRFVALLNGDSFRADLQTMEKELDQLSKKEGHSWKFEFERCFVGYESPYHKKWLPANPFVFNYDDDDEEMMIPVRDEEHLLLLMIAKKSKELEEMKESVWRYTPVPEVDTDFDGFGYCLYQTVSEGTPVTPVFETKNELVDYLVEHGNFWAEKYTRANAESLVSNDYSLGSFVVVNNKMYSSSTQADDIDKALGTKE